MKTALDELFDLLDQAGAKVTLYGKPTTREEVRRVAMERALARLKRGACGALPVGGGSPCELPALHPGVHRGLGGSFWRISPGSSPRSPRRTRRSTP